MNNLLTETEEILRENGKNWDDVTQIIVDDCLIPVDVFKKVANTFYNDGFGEQIINETLMIFGAGFWLEREEYDGSEWWEYRSRIKTKPITTLNETEAAKAIFCN